MEYQTFLQTLGYILDRPTAVNVTPLGETKEPIEMSILKQCLLFDKANLRATISIFKIAEHLELYFSNYIDSLMDLALII